MRQKVFSKNAVDALRVALNSEEGLERYISGIDPFEGFETLISPIQVGEDLPDLSGDADLDFDNAVRLYEYLGPISRMEASDERLWAYLSHVSFLDYCRSRWPITGDISTEDGRKEAKTKVVEHWFTSSDNRTLRRHGIARLWWPVHLTVAPWEREPEQFDSLEREDRYWLTKALMGPKRQDLYQAALERGLGRSQIILLALLAFIDANPATQKRSVWRPLIMELNLMLSYRKIFNLNFHEALEIVQGIYDGGLKLAE